MQLLEFKRNQSDLRSTALGIFGDRRAQGGLHGLLGMMMATEAIARFAYCYFGEQTAICTALLQCRARRIEDEGCLKIEFGKFQGRRNPAHSHRLTKFIKR